MSAKTKRTAEWISLPDAALELGLAYDAARAAGLRGVLRMRRDGYRWVVLRASVAALKRNRQPAESLATAGDVLDGQG